MGDYGLSEKECIIIRDQAARRAQMRAEFLKQKTNPWKHASEAGYVFDPALQRFLSMKCTQYEFFQPNAKNGLFAVFGVIMPMVVYGYVIWNDRNKKEQKMRRGEIRYRDRLFKLI